VDEQIRALEQRYRGSGAPGDGADWLLARVRAGELAHGALGAAAVCGDEAARAASSRLGPRRLGREDAESTLSRPLLERLRAAGCPEGRAGRRLQFDLLEIVRWLEARGWLSFDPVEVSLRAIHHFDRASAVLATLVACGEAIDGPRLLGRWIDPLVASWLDPARATLPSRHLRLRALRAEVVSRALRLVELAPRPIRHAIVVSDGEPHGESMEQEIDTFHDVRETRTGRTVLQFMGTSWQRWEGPDWSEPSLSGTAAVEVSADGWELLVRPHGGEVERIPLPA